MLSKKYWRQKYLILQTELTKTTLTAKIDEVKGEIPSITNLATTAAINGKINEVKNKIPNITNLATTPALTAVENKTPTLINLHPNEYSQELCYYQFSVKLARSVESCNTLNIVVPPSKFSN